MCGLVYLFFFQAEDGIRDGTVTGVQTCALPISRMSGVHASPQRTARARDAAPGGPSVSPYGKRSGWQKPVAMTMVLWGVIWCRHCAAVRVRDRKSVV